MPTVHLPNEPSFEQLRNQARDLQRAVRHGQPEALALVAQYAPELHTGPGGFPLRLAQLVIARRYGFPSWPRLKRHIEIVAGFTRRPDDVPAGTDPVAEFLRLACLTYGADSPDRRAAARDLLAAHPDIPSSGIHAAAATASVDDVERVLAADRPAARREGGPFGWEPLMYLAYARHADPSLDAVVTTARLLVAAGADPNVGYLWHGLPSPFTALTGAFGGGEEGPIAQPPHPQTLALARVLLEAGADPNDAQALYNRMFEPDDDHLVLLFEFGLGTGDGGPWRARLGPTLESPAALVRRQ